MVGLSPAVRRRGVGRGSGGPSDRRGRRQPGPVVEGLRASRAAGAGHGHDRRAGGRPGRARGSADRRVRAPVGDARGAARDTARLDGDARASSPTACVSQVPRLLQGGRAARLTTLLNKADGPAGQASGLAVAEELLGSAASGGAVPSDGADRRPDALVIASLRERRFARVSTMEVRDSGDEAAQKVAGAAPQRGPDEAVAGGRGRLVGAVVLAAGRATRMGAQKLLLPLARAPDGAMGRRRRCRLEGERTIVVVGHEAERGRRGPRGPAGDGGRQRTTRKG